MYFGTILIHDGLGCTGHYTVECGILQNMMRVRTKTKIIDFRRVSFSLLRAQLREILWESSIDYKAASKCWQFLKSTPGSTKNCSSSLEMKQEILLT